MKTVLWKGLAWCVLVLVMGLTVYRAKTQTIGHDEALEYEWFLDGSVYHVLQYNPANHILFTLLAKPFVWALGVSEFILRLPSVLGTVIYLLATYFLCKRVFGTGILLFLSVALLCLNPQIVDFMPAARGYILGLAGLMTAMCAMAWLIEQGEFDSENKGWLWGCNLASVALAVLLLGTPTNIVPVTCLVLTFSVVAMGGFRALLDIRNTRLRPFAKYFLGPGAAVGFCVLWPYAIQVRPSAFYAGLRNASDSLKDAFTGSFLFKWTEDVYAPSLGAVPAAAGSWQERLTILGVFVLMPLLFCVVTVGVILAWRAANHAKTKESAQCQVFGGAAIACVALIVLLHVAARAHYPNVRYCLFLIPLFTVGGLLASRQVTTRFPSSYLKAIGLVIAGIIVLDYALSLQARQSRYNAYDVISLRLYQAIADDAQRRGLKSVRVGGTWWYEPEINFYRRKLNATWMAEYDVVDKSYFWKSPNALPPADYDYFVFIPASDPGLAGPNIRTILHDGVRGVTVVVIER